jgi:hypothetical protein
MTMRNKQTVYISLYVVSAGIGTIKGLTNSESVERIAEMLVPMAGVAGLATELFDPNNTEDGELQTGEVLMGMIKGSGGSYLCYKAGELFGSAICYLY